ncbi:lectin-like protein [Profundibacter sp.]
MRNYRNLALATALTALTAGAAQAVPVQWETSAGGNDHWYDVVISFLTFGAANTAATSSSHLGETGYLASITSAGEQSFLNSLNPFNLNSWLGGTDSTTEGTWEWTTGEAFTYTNWYGGEPNDYRSGEDNLVGWWGGDRWNDLNNVAVSTAYVVEYGNVAPVPLPAGLPLILGALGVLGIVGRRRKVG